MIGVEVGVMAPDIGDEVAATPSLEELYEREWPALVRLAFLLTGSTTAAEDVAQDAFVGLQSTAAAVANPPAYLRTSVVNACRSLHRRQAVADRHPTPPPEPVRSEPDELFDAVGRLPWRQQAALAMRFDLGLPEAEIAAALRCRPATVRSIIHRALKALRKELSE